jgi:hypothetical protein
MGCEQPAKLITHAQATTLVKNARAKNNRQVFSRPGTWFPDASGMADARRALTMDRLSDRIERFARENEFDAFDRCDTYKPKNRCNR